MQRSRKEKVLGGATCVAKEQREVALRLEVRQLRVTADVWPAGRNAARVDTCRLQSRRDIDSKRIRDHLPRVHPADGHEAGGSRKVTFRLGSTRRKVVFRLDEKSCFELWKMPGRMLSLLLKALYAV